MRSSERARSLLQRFLKGTGDGNGIWGKICDAVSFDPEVRASQATECLLVGFGRVGQECLRKIVANGQFEGSTFHLAVFDPELENLARSNVRIVHDILFAMPTETK